MLNRRKPGGSAATGPGAEFFNAAEANQLNTLLRGEEADPDAKAEAGAPSNSQEPGAAEPTVRCVFIIMFHHEHHLPPRRGFHGNKRVATNERHEWHPPRPRRNFLIVRVCLPVSYFVLH